MISQRKCPDCQTQTMSFIEYCTKCGADLHQAGQNAKKSERHN